MAMSVGSAGAEPDVMVDINTTPLIDVMLVLLIMLIITIPIQLHSVNLNMPAGNPPPPTKEPVVVTIDIDFDGTVLWNGEALPDRHFLTPRRMEGDLLAETIEDFGRDRISGEALAMAATLIGHPPPRAASHRAA